MANLFAVAVFDSIWNWFYSPQTTPADRIALIAVFVSVLTALVSVIVGFAASLLGAKLGASAAYKLGRTQQQRDYEDKIHNALTVSQFALISQINTLAFIKSHYLDPHRDKKRPFASIGIINVSSTKLFIPFAEISSFIVNSPNPKLLSDLHHSEIEYLGTLDTVANLREEGLKLVDSHKASRKIVDANIKLAAVPVTEEEAIMVHALTINLYQMVDEQVPEFVRLSSELTAFIKQSFPDRMALAIKDVPKGAKKNERSTPD